MDGHGTQPGILIGKESHFPLWLLREKGADPGLDNYLPKEEKKLPEDEADTEESAQRQEGENPQAQKTRFKTCLKSILHLDSSATEPIGGGQEEDVTAC